MPATYEPIATITLGSAASSIEFTAIPGSFTDLVIVAMVDTDDTGGSTQSIPMRLNGDTGSNYSHTLLFGNGTSAVSSRGTNQSTGTYVGEVSATLNYSNPMIIQIMSYANTNVFKTVLSQSAVAAAFVTRSVGLWRNTSAVTSIALNPSGRNFTTGSTVSLYGIKASA